MSPRTSTARVLLPALLLAFASLAARAEDQRMRYAFDGKKAGNMGVPHVAHRGEWKELSSPFAPKGKELTDADYKLIGSDKDNNGAAEMRAEGRGRAGFVLVFQVEKEVHKNAKAWKGMELEVSAIAGAGGNDSGNHVEVELYRADNKSWTPLKSDMPEGWNHFYVIEGPYAPLPDREGRIAVRVSSNVEEPANHVLLDFARLTIKLEGIGGDPLTYVSLAGRCKITRPDDPVWGFQESDDWFIRMVKGEDLAVDITIKRYDADMNYRFDDKTVSGDNAKGIAEGVLKSILGEYKTKQNPSIKKGQLGAYKTQEFSLIGEAKGDGKPREIREVFIREKGNTYRISIWGNPQTMKEDRYLIERSLKTFAITE